MQKFDKNDITRIPKLLFCSILLINDQTMTLQKYITPPPPPKKKKKKGKKKRGIFM